MHRRLLDVRRSTSEMSQIVAAVDHDSKGQSSVGWGCGTGVQGYVIMLTSAAAHTES